MRYYTQSGNRRSDRIAGNPPETNYNPQHNTRVQNTFSPFNDTQAAADGVSYGSSHDSPETNVNPTQDNIAFLIMQNVESSRGIRRIPKYIQCEKKQKHGTTVSGSSPHDIRTEKRREVNHDTKSPIISARKHQLEQLHDPLAKQCTGIRKNKIIGDGDTWVETLCGNVKTGEIKSFFISMKDPNHKVPDEPPTGASHVIYLKASYVNDKLNR